MRVENYLQWFLEKDHSKLNGIGIQPWWATWCHSQFISNLPTLPAACKSSSYEVWALSTSQLWEIPEVIHIQCLCKVYIWRLGQKNHTVQLHWTIFAFKKMDTFLWFRAGFWGTVFIICPQIFYIIFWGFCCFVFLSAGYQFQVLVVQVVSIPVPMNFILLFLMLLCCKMSSN